METEEGRGEEQVVEAVRMKDIRRKREYKGRKTEGREGREG